MEWNGGTDGIYGYNIQLDLFRSLSGLLVPTESQAESYQFRIRMIYFCMEIVKQSDGNTDTHTIRKTSRNTLECNTKRLQNIMLFRYQSRQRLITGNDSGCLLISLVAFERSGVHHHTQTHTHLFTFHSYLIYAI